jgi:putative lipoprotein
MKQIVNLLLSGIVLLATSQNNPYKQTDKDVENIDSIKQETNIDSIKQNAKLDNVKQVLAQTTDPLKRIKLHQQIIDIKIAGASPEERCRIFDDFSAQVQKELNKINEREFYYTENYYSFRIDDDGNEKEPHDSIKKKDLFYKKAGIDTIELGEGNVELTLPTKFYTKYVKQLPKYYQDFWNLKKEAANIAPEGALVKTWRELGNLLARFEAYAKANPTQKELFCRLKDNYKFLQTAYLFGTEYTTSVNFDSIYKKVKDELKRFIKAYPDSPTTPFAKEMLLLNKYEDMEIIFQKLIKFQETSDYPLLKACSFEDKDY